MNPTQAMFKSIELASSRYKFNFMAQDQDGTIKAFTHKPLRDEVDWYTNYLIPGAVEIVVWTPNKKVFITNWSESLIQEGKE